MSVRNILWTRIDALGAEYLELEELKRNIIGRGTILTVDAQEKPFECRYEISCDRDWCVQLVSISVNQQTKRSRLELISESGLWSRNGKRLPMLNGCIDVDISATGFTNTLPIRRLSLPVGKSQEIEVVYIEIPSLLVRRARQRYTHLQVLKKRHLYLYESLQSGFKARLTTDSAGIVLDYPGLLKASVAKSED